MDSVCRTWTYVACIAIMILHVPACICMYVYVHSSDGALQDTSTSRF